MVILLNQTQQERVYKSFQRFQNRIAQRQMSEATRSKEIDDSRVALQQRVNEKDLQGLPLQEAMLEYLQIREHEEALHLPPTPVPVILFPHFQNISYPELQAVVNRLAVFRAPLVLANPPQPAQASIPVAPPDAVSWAANYEVVINAYKAVRHARITDPETIRELAQRFLTIANDPEANANFPFDAERAADTLFKTARWYEEKGHARDI